jgi:hypothetical protein
VVGMDMMIAVSSRRSTPQGRLGASAGVTTTRAGKCSVSVGTALNRIVFDIGFKPPSTIE